MVLEKIMIQIESAIKGSGLGKAQKQLLTFEDRLFMIQAKSARAAKKLEVFALKTKIAAKGVNSISDAIGRTNFTNATDMANNALNRYNATIISNNQKLRQNNLDTKTLTKQMSTFGGVMSATIPQMIRFEKIQGKIQNRSARIAMGIRKTTLGLGKFRMELLGVMFFGQAVMGFFSGLLRPAADAFGIFDLWQVMLMDFFIPTMEKLFPHLLNFMTWVMDLPVPVKKLIGAMVLLGLVAGFVAMIFGTIGLGIGSSILVGWTKFSKIIAGINFTGVVLPLLLVVAAIIAGKKGLDELADSSDKGKEAVEGLSEGFDMLKGIISQPFINSVTDLTDSVDDNATAWVGLGAIVSSTVAFALIGFGSMATGARLAFNGIIIAVGESMNWILKKMQSTLLKTARFADKLGLNKIAAKYRKAADMLNQPISTISEKTQKSSDAFEDSLKRQIDLMEKLESSIISPTEAIIAYRDELEKTDKVGKITNAPDPRDFLSLYPENAPDLKEIPLFNQKNGINLVSRPSTSVTNPIAVDVNYKPELNIDFANSDEFARKMEENNKKLTEQVDKMFRDNLRRMDIN